MPIYSALLDSNTQIVLALSDNISAIVFLNECMSDTSHAVSVNYPNYTKSLFHEKPFFLAREKPEHYPRWTWKEKTRTFVKTRPDVLTDGLIARSRLAVSKHGAISRIIVNLNQACYKVRTGFEFQETVYLTKKLQAQKFKDSGYDENVIMEYPYVLHYADYAGIPLKEAADDILFQAKLDDQHLANTELLRLRYFNKVRDATKPEQLPAIFEEFLRDCYINVKIY